MQMQVQGVPFKQTPHPVLKEITREQALALGEEKTKELLIKREEIIFREKSDPLNFGYEPYNWKDADELAMAYKIVCIFGGNRAGKTEYVVKRAMQMLATKENVKVLFLHNNDLSSKETHQEYCWRYMPHAWKNLRRGKNAKGSIAFDPKNKFSDNKFVTPLNGTAIFGNYGQELGKYEGLEFDLIVCDEFLPLKWYLGLLRGLATRGGRLWWAFTAIDGMTQAVNEVAGGAQTIRSKPINPRILPIGEKPRVDDCPVGEMPYIAKKGRVGIIYFHTEDNPFGGFENLLELYGDKDETVRERRFYGYARKKLRVIFPKFEDRHVLPHDVVTQELLLPNTRYHVADPAGARNMFQIWLAVFEDGRHIVYREWPDVFTLGEWAVASEDAKKWDGDAGPAQPTLGMGVIEYKGLILKLEGNVWTPHGWEPGENFEDIFERRIDPRSGAAQSVAERDGGSSLMDRFNDEQTDRAGIVVGPSMLFIPAPGLPEAENIHGGLDGISAINDMLNFDPQKPITRFLNEPKLFISDKCQNLIWALSNYTGNDGAKAACKDPIDDLRYAITSDFVHITPAMMRARGGGAY